MKLSQMFIWGRTHGYMSILDPRNLSPEALTEKVGDSPNYLVMPLNVVTPAIINKAEEIGATVISPQPGISKWAPGELTCEVDGKHHSVGEVLDFTVHSEVGHRTFRKKTGDFNTVYRDVHGATCNLPDIEDISVNLHVTGPISGVHKLRANSLLVLNEEHSIPGYVLCVATRADELPSAESVVEVYSELKRTLTGTEQIEYICEMAEHHKIDDIADMQLVENALFPLGEHSTIGPGAIRVIAERYGITHADMEDYMVTFESPVF